MEGRKCYDAECRARQARSSEFPVPPHILPLLPTPEQHRAEGQGKAEAEEDGAEEEEAAYIRAADALLEQMRTPPPPTSHPHTSESRHQPRVAEDGAGRKRGSEGAEALSGGVQLPAAECHVQPQRTALEEEEEEEYIRLADQLLASFPVIER